MQLVALVAAAQEGPVGVETALLTGSPQVTFIHIWGCQEKRSEDPGAAQSPHFTRCPGPVRKGASFHPHHPGPASPTQERLLGPSWKPGSHWQRKEPGRFTQRCWQ